MECDAIESPQGAYRYELTRLWEPDGWIVCWIMLNPSTADAVRDDPTIRRCIEFSRRMGCAGMSVVNLYAYRASDPAELAACTVEEREAPSNLYYIRAAMMTVDRIMAAWGRPQNIPGYARVLNDVTSLAYRHMKDLYCLGVNGDGSPKHPSPLGRVPLDTTPKIWRAA